MWREYSKNIVKDICFNCGSRVSKKSASYIDYLYHCLPSDKILCECIEDKGFYFATKGRDHARLIEIAVRNEEKGKGYGKILLYRLLQRMKAEGLFKLTFRSPIDEPAQYFWTHHKARVVGLKDNDYEMELNFK